MSHPVNATASHAHAMGAAPPQVVVALDLDDPAAAEMLAQELLPHTRHFKVGPELLLAGGPSLIERLRARGVKVFLDLKFHDIPTTVLRSARRACALRPHMFDVHALAGTDAMRAAVAASYDVSGAERPLVIAITLLASHDHDYVSQRFRFGTDITSVVLHLADEALSCGVDGVVCSPREAGQVRARFGTQLRIVSPGVRFREGYNDDYPSQRLGRIGDRGLSACDYIVVGRPITQCLDPAATMIAVLQLLRCHGSDQ